MVNSITTSSAMNAVFPALDPVKQKKADEIKAVLQQTLDSLKNGKPDINAQRKAAAAQRVTQLKEAMKNLRQMVGMDPKAMARMLAMLAKQLASAVKEYKAAGGSDNAVSATVSTSAPSSSTSASGASPVDQTMDQGDMQAVESDTMANNTKGLLGGIFGQGASAYQQTQTITTRQSSRKDVDYAFLRDAKSLLGEMKGMLEAQRQRLKRQKGGVVLNADPDFNSIKSGSNALDEVEKALQTIQARSFSV